MPTRIINHRIFFAVAFTCDDPNDPLNDLCQNGGTCGGDECYCPSPRCTGKLCEICKGKFIADESIKLLFKFNRILSLRFVYNAKNSHWWFLFFN